jgi:beta-phosphoglucomutase
MKACLFDLDGVIVDTAKFHFIAWRRLANALGFNFTEHQNEQLKGISRMESLEMILQWGNITLDEHEKAQWAKTKNDWYLDLVNEMNADDILPDVERFLKELKTNKIKIALGSASKNAHLILEKVGLLHYFDAIIDGNSVTKGKPDPQVFLLGAETLGVKPKDCVVFEDAVAGIEAAKAGGMKAIGIGQADVLTQANLVVEGFTALNFDIVIHL